MGARFSHSVCWDCGISNMAAPNKKSVLFVCLGNICRSPIAEAVFRNLVKQQGKLEEWRIDSAATADYHIGEPPDQRAVSVLKNHGVDVDHVVRQVIPEDFAEFKYIFGMDHANIKNLKSKEPKHSTTQIQLLGEYDPQKELIIADPYYGDEKEFEEVYEQALRCCQGFLDHVSN